MFDNLIISIIVGYLVVTVVLAIMRKWLQWKVITFLVGSVLTFVVGLYFVINDTKTAIVSLIAIAVIMGSIVWIYAIILRFKMLKQARSYNQDDA